MPQPGGSSRDSLGDLTGFRPEGRQLPQNVSVPPRGYEKSWPIDVSLGSNRATGDVKQRAECWLNSAQPGVSIIDLRPQAAEVYKTRSC